MGGRKDLITAGLTLGALADAAAKAKGKMSAIIATESGPAVSFTAADAAPVVDLTAAIVPVQSGSGDPSPTNIRPISGWTECKVTRAGKNLIDLSGFQQYANWSAILAQYGDYPTANANKGYLLNVVPGIEYTISFGISSTSFPTFLYLCRANGYDTSQRITSFSTGSYLRSEYTFTAEVGWIYYIHMGSTITQELFDTQTSNISYAQLELGSAATAYEPYRGDTYTVTFGSAGTVYGGTLNVTTGTLTVDRETVELSENWNWKKSTNYPGGYYVIKPERKLKTTIISTHAKTVTKKEDYVYGTCYGDDAINIRIMDENSTLQDWKDYISAQRSSETPIFFCYELDTPVVYNLMPVEIRTLAGQNTIWADTGSVTVKYTACTKAFIDKYIAARRNG